MKESLSDSNWLQILAGDRHQLFRQPPRTVCATPATGSAAKLTLCKLPLGIPSRLFT